MKRLLIAIASLASALAAAQGAEQPATRMEKYHVDYVLNADGTHAETRHQELKVLRESAIAGLKRTSVSHSTSVQKAEILEAYTRKPDGRRVDAPANNFQVEVNSGRGKDLPAFSDHTSVTVIFPDVAVGDVLVLRYRITQTEAIFPGHFSAHEVFPTVQPFGEARVRVEAPATLPLRFAPRRLDEAPSVEKEGRRIREWSIRNPATAKATRRNWSVYDGQSEPGLIVSTFASHDEIARAYGARAEPKAALTPRVRELAATITKGLGAPRDKARALYDWVATEITYAGNCVGAGAVVPRDLGFVLDNKMGDCKDHATLLQALLSAEGIKSTQALVNSGSAYTLPPLPVVSMVNHVINYLPELDLYVDSTSSDTPFGHLPFGSADKPVLLVDGSRAGARTPATPAGVNRQVARTEVWIRPDGSVKGSLQVQQKGLFAATSRSAFRSLAKDQEERWLKSMFGKDGREGFGAIDREDPKPLRDSYRFSVKFETPGVLQLPGAGAFPVGAFFSTDASIAAMLAAAAEPLEDVDITCSNGYSEEEYVFHLPKGMRVLAMPKNVAVTGESMTYKATYARKGDTITVKRVLDDRTRGNVCSPKYFGEYRKLALKAMQDLRSQVVYQ